jgi:WD40 repeat protein
VVVVASGGDEVVLLDLEHDREIWRHPCQMCSPLEVSADGSRLAQLGVNGLEVWDARANRVLLTETARLNGFESAVSISPDGQRVAWTDGASVRVRDLASHDERALQLESPATRVRFSPDSRFIAAITAASLVLFDAREGRLLWTVPHATPDRPIQLAWSADLTSLLVWYQSLGTELLDARTGARVGRFPATGSVVPAVSPDLRTKLVATESNWELRPLPQPASDSPSETLAMTLRKTGLALEGVEIVAR